jgi:hypothetical protein
VSSSFTLFFASNTVTVQKTWYTFKNWDNYFFIFSLKNLQIIAFFIKLLELLIW